MKKFLKWAAIGIGGLTLLVIFFNQDIESQRWGMLGAAIGWFAYTVTIRLDGIKADLARLQGDIYDLKNTGKFSEEVLLELKRKLG